MAALSLSLSLSHQLSSVRTFLSRNDLTGALIYKTPFSFSFPSSAPAISFHNSTKDSTMRKVYTLGANFVSCLDQLFLNIFSVAAAMYGHGTFSEY